MLYQNLLSAIILQVHFWCNVSAFEDSCGMATVDKCNGVINPDGSDMPRNPNLMEVSKE